MEAELVWPSADSDSVNLRRTRDGHDDFTVEVSSQLLSQQHEGRNLKQNAQALQVSQTPGNSSYGFTDGTGICMMTTTMMTLPFTLSSGQIDAEVLNV